MKFINSPDKTMDPAVRPDEQLVRLETHADIVGKCRGVDDATPNGTDPNDLGPLYPPVYMNNTTKTCYNEEGVIAWTKFKLPARVPDPTSRGNWIIPTELLARIDSFPVKLIAQLLEEPVSNSQRSMAMELFRKKIPYAVSYHEGSDNSCMLLMCSKGMVLQAKQWFRQTLRYRKVFNMYMIRELNYLGLVQEAKRLFTRTYTSVRSYNSGVIRELYLLWGEEEARLMFRHTVAYHTGGGYRDYLNIARMYRMLNLNM